MSDQHYENSVINMTLVFFMKCPDKGGGGGGASHYESRIANKMV